MVSVVFAVLVVSFSALTTVVKLPWKFLTLIFIVDSLKDADLRKDVPVGGLDDE